MINYEIFGHGKPLVLLHGWGFDKDIWKPLIPHLTNQQHVNFKVYLIDLPGFGKTPYINWDAFKDELLKILPEKFIVLGWSLGGLFATRLTIEAPERVEKFINVAASPRFNSTDNWIGIDAEVLDNFHMRFINNPHKTRYDFVSTQLLDDSGLEIHLSDELNIEGLGNGLEILTTWDLRNYLLDVKQPGLFIFGKLDGIVNRRVMPLLQKTYPNFNYVMLKKSAHMPFLSHMHEFIEIVVKFCINESEPRP